MVVGPGVRALCVRVSIFHRHFGSHHDWFTLKDFLDFYGRYLYLYAILAHSTVPMHLLSTRFITANHIYRYQPCVLPYHTGTDPCIRTSLSVSIYTILVFFVIISTE